MNMYLVWLEYCFHGNLKDYITRNREYFINEEQNTEFNIRTVRVRGGGREGKSFQIPQILSEINKNLPHHL